MGFLDDLKKGMGDLADGINKAVGSATAPAAGSPPPPSGPPPPGAVAPPPPPAGVAPAPDRPLDVARPDTWLDPARLAAVLGARLGTAVAFGPPMTFEADGLAVARFTSTDGAVTVDVASYPEERLGALGSADAVCTDAAAGLPGSQRLARGFDDGVQGSKGAGHGAFVGCLGDAVGRVDVYGPATAALAEGAGDVLAAAFGV